MIQSLYAAHQPWKNKELSFKDRAELSRFFTLKLVRLFLKDERCKQRTREICTLDMDPIYDAQDFEEDETVSISPSKSENPSTYEVVLRSANGHWTKILRYDLRETHQGWRIQNIHYPEGPSLEKILSL